MHERSSRWSVMVLIPLLLVAVRTQAQDNHYWTQQNGARATLMGGAASASIDDQAVLFYNPAAAGRVKGTGITASANFIYMQWLQVKDLDDLGIEAKESASNNAPKLLVGSFDPGGNERLRISFGFVNSLYGRFAVRQAANIRVEADAQQPGPELLTGFLNINTTTREDLLGAGASYLLGDHGSIGLNLFASMFSQGYQSVLDLGLFGALDQQGAPLTLAARTVNEQVELFNIGLLARLGYFHVRERLQWGITLTMPRLDVIGNNGTYYRSATEITMQGPGTKDQLYGLELPTSFRTPWMADLGLEARTGTTVWAFRLGLAGAVDAYDRIALDPANDLSQGALAPEDGSFRRVRSASVPVVNAGIGGQFRLNANADLLAGVRTDVNHLDLSRLDKFTDLTGTFSYWDLYHASCGVDWHSTRAQFTAGLVYSWGTETSTPRELAALGAFLPALNDSRFKTGFNQLGLTFGISYFILGAGPVKPE